MSMDKLVQRLKRNYYFFEAMAFYEAYYSPLSESLSAESYPRIKATIESPERRHDHPLTWVPIVFHCTDFKSFKGIVADGVLRAPVSLTEIPIGELDRMKVRTSRSDQIAIGFPRRYLQTRKLASVLHTRHHPELTDLLQRREDIRQLLKPFLAVDDDVSAFQELKSADELDISDAVWLLTTKRKDKKPVVPALETFTKKWGHIATSFWHRTHQMGILGEWQYLRVDRDEITGRLTAVEVLGEHYWKTKCYTEVEQVVRMPAGKDVSIRFWKRRLESKRFEGPYNFFDLALRMKELLSECSAQHERELPYALFSD